MFKVPRKQIVHTVERRHCNVQSILYCFFRHRPVFYQFFGKSNRFLTQYK